MVISRPQKENEKGIKAAQVEGPWQDSEEPAALGARKEQLVKPFRSGNQRASDEEISSASAVREPGSGAAPVFEGLCMTSAFFLLKGACGVNQSDTSRTRTQNIKHNNEEKTVRGKELGQGGTQIRKHVRSDHAIGAVSRFLQLENVGKLVSRHFRKINSP